VEAEVLDAGALARPVPGAATLLNALSTKGETPAWVLAKSRLEGGDSIRIERDATSFPWLGRPMIEPRNLPRKIDTIPFQSENFTCPTARRKCKSDDRFHMARHGIKQSVVSGDLITV
jgi:hypothetical protein